jgi:adenosylmethionine-8-amino-7-oxononanoate aminotransferase
VSCAVALANLDAFDREDVLPHVRANEKALVEQLRVVSELPIVGDLRGAGYFWALELVKDAATMETFTREESDELLRGFLGPRFLELGLIARIDDRVRPVVQLAPPLIAGPDEFEVMADRLHTALTEAGDRFQP